MKWLIGVSVALIVAIPVLLTLLFRARRKPPKCVYQTNAALFTPEERTLFALLREAVGEDFEILGKIRVGEIIQPRRGTQAPGERSRYEAMTERCFPFVLCRKSDLSVACAMEWRERAHEDRKAFASYDLLQALCAAAGLPLVPLHAGTFYQAEELREAVTNALQLPSLPVPHGDGRKEPRISSVEGLNLD